MKREGWEAGLEQARGRSQHPTITEEELHDLADAAVDGYLTPTGRRKLRLTSEIAPSDRCVIRAILVV